MEGESMSEWKEVRLGDVLDFHRGYDLPKSEMENGDIPVAGSNGIIGFHNKATAITPCITIGRSGSIGQPFYYERAWAHNTVLYIDDFKGNNPKFLYYLIKILPISNFAGGSAVPSLNRNHIHPLVIKFCDDIEKQKEIAGILSSLDAKIETNNKLNEKLEEMAQAIFKSWLDGCDETVQIDDLSLNITDYSKLNKDKVILINSSDVTNGFFDHHNYSDNNKLKGHFKKRFSKGDILYSQVRPRNRHWAYCYFDAEDYIASTQLMVIRNNPEKVSSLLLYQYLISDRVWNEFTLKTETRSGTFPQGNYEDLSKICVPYKKDNEKISKTLEHIYNIIYNRYDENQRLASLRDTLLPRLMSGELIV